MSLPKSPALVVSRNIARPGGALLKGLYGFCEAVVASRKRRPFTGLLLKPIYLGDAKPRGLNAAFAQPPDQGDIKAYALQEIYARYAALDKFFSLDSNSRHIWQQRANALLAYVFNIPPDAFQSSAHLANYLTERYVPGFSLKLPGERRLGVRSEWDFEQSAQLFADIEFLKRNTGKSVSEICKILPPARSWRCTPAHDHRHRPGLRSR